MGIVSGMTAAEDPLPPGAVRREGAWAVGNVNGADFAVSRRCRHQFGDLSKGLLDSDGCLVCPWHQSRYDVTTGEMVSGPVGFLAYHGKTGLYGRSVLAYGRRWRLRIGTVVRSAGRVTVTRS